MATPDPLLASATPDVAAKESVTLDASAVSAPGGGAGDCYDDMIQGMLGEKEALAPPPRVSPHALPTRAYLDQTIVPLLLHGLEAAAVDRPKDPVEYLAAYLISNNPQRDPNLPNPGHPVLAGLTAAPETPAPSAPPQ